MFKKIFTTITLAAALISPIASANPVHAGTRAKSNWQIVQEIVEKHYPGKKIRIVSGNGKEDDFWKAISHRKNKSYVVVEKTISTGDGTKHGWYTTADGNKYIIGYNKKVSKGKRIVSYIIWNPESNECDTVDYVVDNSKAR